VARLYRARDELDEARYVAEEIVKLLNERQITEAGQAAALFRTNSQARALAAALRTRGIAVQMRADADLFVRAEIRDALAYLRLAHNPHDAHALARVMDTPPRRLRASGAFRKHRGASRPPDLRAAPRIQQKRR
jgi:DNA helicase-2/ATP-dependent DNA helicase PcrA